MSRTTPTIIKGWRTILGLSKDIRVQKMANPSGAHVIFNIYDGKARPMSLDDAMESHCVGRKYYLAIFPSRRAFLEVKQTGACTWEVLPVPSVCNVM